MRDNLIVFPATTKYLDEARVLLRSLTRNMPDVPVHVITRDGEADCLKTEFPQIVEKVISWGKEFSEFKQIRTSRFKHAADVADQFRVVCLLDADMCCFRDFHHLFRMADTGTILVGANNTLYRYVKKDFDKMHVPCDPKIDVVHGSFCTVPLIINPTIHKKFLLDVFGNFTGNDLDVPNLIAASTGLMKRVYHLPSYICLNIHHTCLKPETGVRATDDGLYSHQGYPVYIMHGHWLDGEYVKNLLAPMQKNYGYYPKYVENAKNCIRIISKEYDKYRK